MEEMHSVVWMYNAGCGKEDRQTCTYFVDRLAKEGKQIEALSFAHAFGIMDRVQPIPLLKAYLKEARRTAQSILKTGNSSAAAQVTN